MHRIVAAPAARRGPSLWLFAVLTATVWFEVLWRSAAASSSLPPALAALAGLASQLAFTALEASLGVAVWGALGTRVPWSGLAPRLLTVSATEAAAVAIVSGRPALPVPWAVLLAGARADPSAATPGVLAQTVAAFGVLTLVRLVLAVHAHATAARTSGRRAAFVVLGFYLASRCAMWWTLDLMRGQSFEMDGVE